MIDYRRDGKGKKWQSDMHSHVSPDRKGDDSDIYDMVDLNTKNREADFFITDNLIDASLLFLLKSFP
jgi:hypothetical protein